MAESGKPNAWEIFLFRNSLISCPLFLVVGFLCSAVVYQLATDEKIKFNERGVWDVRGDNLIDGMDAFAQAKDRGQNTLGVLGDAERTDKPTYYREKDLDTVFLIYEAFGEGANVFSPTNLKKIRKFEAFVYSELEDQDLCRVEQNTTELAKCTGMLAALNFLYSDPLEHQQLVEQGYNYPGSSACEASPDLQFGRDFPCLSPSFFYTEGTSETETPETLAKLCSASNLAAAGMSPAKIHFSLARSLLYSTDFTCSPQRQSQFARTFLPVGFPQRDQKFANQTLTLPEDFDFTKSWTFFDALKKTQTDAWKESFEDSDGFYAKIVQKKQEIEGTKEDLRIYIGSGELFGKLFKDLAIADGMLATGSLGFVFAWLAAASGSFFLALTGVLQILFSLPVGVLAFWLIGRTYIGFLCVMMLFIIIGIGADDIFVFLDAWRQSRYEKHIQDSPELRFRFAYRRASKAMFVTTMTTLCGFLAIALLSKIPSISTFGIFASFIVLFDYLFCITFFAASVGVYNRFFEDRWGGHSCGLANFLTKRKLNFFIVFGGVFLVGLALVVTQPRQDVPSKFVMLNLPMLLVLVGNVRRETNFRPLEVFLRFTFFNALHKFRKFLVIGWIILGIAGCIVTVTHLKPADDNADFVHGSHDIMRMIKSFDSFDDGGTNPVVTYVYGLDQESPIDRTNQDPLTPSTKGGGPMEEYSGVYLGEVRFDPSFHNVMATTAGQEEALQLCTDLLVHPTLTRAKPSECDTTVVEGHREPVLNCQTGVYCPMQLVRDFLEEEGGLVHSKNCRDITPGYACTFPSPTFHEVVRSTEFAEYVKQDFERTLLRAGSPELERLQEHQGFIYSADNKLNLMWSSLNSTMQFSSMPYDEKKDWFNAFSAVPANTLLTPFHSQVMWPWMITERELFQSAIRGILLSVAFSFLVILLISQNRNIILSTMTVASIAIIFFTVTTFFVIMGWTIGIAESISLMTIIGLSVDYSVHIMHAYDQSTAPSRREKTQEALGTMGISLVSGFATTFGSAFFLVFCDLTFFRRFGAYLMVVVVVSLITAFTFLIPLCAVLGPQGGRGDLAFLCRRKPRSLKTSTEIEVLDL